MSYLVPDVLLPRATEFSDQLGEIFFAGPAYKASPSPEAISANAELTHVVVPAISALYARYRDAIEGSVEERLRKRLLQERGVITEKSRVVFVAMMLRHEQELRQQQDFVDLDLDANTAQLASLPHGARPPSPRVPSDTPSQVAKPALVVSAAAGAVSPGAAPAATAADPLFRLTDLPATKRPKTTKAASKQE